MSRTADPRWTPPALLARLDRAVVPVLQWLARAVAWLLAWPFRTLTRAELRTRLGRRLHRHGGLLLLATVMIGFLASAVHFQRYPDLRDAAAAPDALAGEEPTAAPVPGGTRGPEPDHVGPVVGADVAAYAERSRATVAALPDGASRLAVVSYGEYRTPEEVLASLPQGTQVLAAQWRLPADGERPRRVEAARDALRGALEAAVAAARDLVVAEEEEVRRLLDSGTVEEEAFRADYERRLSELQGLRNLLDTGAPVVFAVVVRASAADLRALSGHGDVRIVDVAPVGADAGDTVFYGVLPEDRDRATFGRDP